MDEKSESVYHEMDEKSESAYHEMDEKSESAYHEMDEKSERECITKWMKRVSGYLQVCDVARDLLTSSCGCNTG